MGAFNQLNGAIFDAGAIEARISAIDGKSIYNQRDGGILDFDSLARRLTALDGKVAVGQGGIEFDVDTFMRRLAAIEAGGFSPLQLFAGGVQGVWYDPSDFATLFQDSAGTTPVTAVGQPVGKMLDKSGNVNHLTQATTTSRPTVQQDGSGFYYLSFDGVDDVLSVTPGTLWTQPFQQFGAVRFDNSLVTDADLFCNVNTAGLLGVASGFYRVLSGVSLLLSGRVLSETVVLTGLQNGASSSIQKNNTTATTGDAGSANPTGVLTVGAGPGALRQMSGRMYGGLIVGRACTVAEIANTKTYLGNKCGLAL